MTDTTLAEPRARPTYAARAFGVQYNLILLGGAGLFSLALASAWPLLAGAIGELLWLGVGSNLGAVRRRLDRRDVFAEEAPVEQPEADEPALERVYQHRLHIFDQALNELRALGVSRGDAAFRRSLAGLDLLRAAFEGLCRTHQGLQSFLSATPEAELVGEVTRLQQAAAAEHDLVAKMGIRQALVLAKRRVEQRQGMLSELATLSLRLETVERALGHLLKQGRALGANAKLATEIEALVAHLRESAPL